MQQRNQATKVTPEELYRKDRCSVGSQIDFEGLNTIGSSFTFVGGELKQTAMQNALADDFKDEITNATSSPGRKDVNASYRCRNPDALKIEENFDISPVGDSFQRQKEYLPSQREKTPEPEVHSIENIEVSPLPYQTGLLEEMSSSPLLELDDNLLCCPPQAMSPPGLLYPPLTHEAIFETSENCHNDLW